MRLPKSLMAAINTYYAVHAHHAHAPKDWKAKCLQAIDAVCTRYKIELCASAGTFFLAKGRQRAQISHPFLPE